MLDRLPYENFRKIIKIQYTSDLLESGLDDKIINLPPIKATHVCRSWRTVLLSDPTMWTSITLTDRAKMHQDQLSAMLYRSSSSPLNVFIDHYDDPTDPFLGFYLWSMLSVVSQHMYRCQQLQVSISVQLAPSVFQCLSQAVPTLQYFDLYVFKGEGSLESKAMLIKIHNILFSGHSPSLEGARLQISGSLNNLQLSLFKNLKNLHLYFLSDTPIHGNMLLDIFQSSPRLCTLHILWDLVDVPKSLSAIPSGSNGRISLSYLQDLTLRDIRIADVDFVLGNLDFSTENIRFDITCNDSPLRISESTLLKHLLSRRRFAFLSIGFGYELMIDFHETMNKGLAFSKFRAVYNCKAPPHASIEDLPKFLRTFNLLDITHMSLGFCSFDYVILRSILVSVVNLQYLLIRHGGLDDLAFPTNRGPIQKSYLKSLLPPRWNSGNSQTGTSLESDADDDITDLKSDIGTYRGQLFPCPSLRTLEIRFYYETLPVRLDNVYLPALVRCSRIRQQAGHSLEYILDCDQSFDMAGDIEAWLEAHKDLPPVVVQVRTARRDQASFSKNNYLDTFYAANMTNA